MNTIAENLSFYRKKNNLTQAQLGELLHVSAQAISKWETGQAEPGLDMILKLAEIYGVTTDTLLSATPTSAPAESAPAPVAPKKPNAFAAWLKKFWFIPVIVLVLAAALTTTLILLGGPAKYGRMLKNGSIQLGMTTAAVQEVLGTPTETATEEEHGIFMSELNYEDATYFVYCDEREPKNEEELWFGIEYEYLRLVFDKNGKLIEGFYNNTPSTDIYGYGNAKHYTVKSYESFLYANGKKTDKGIIIFTDGSVYIGEMVAVSNGKEVSSVVCKIGTFSLLAKEDTAQSGNTSSTGDGSSSSKICAACGDADSTCVRDDRLTGTPLLICKDCRELLFGD